MRHAVHRLSRVILVVAMLLGVAACNGSSVSTSEREQAVIAAKQVFQESKNRGIDFSDGPCIAEQLPEMADWSVDVAHKPRQSVDDQPANQCQHYREGETHHFVELDPNGNLIRTH